MIKLHGITIEGPSLDSMIDKILCTIMLAALPLWAAPRSTTEPLAVQELRGVLHEINYKINAQMSDLRLLEERLAKVENKVEHVASKPTSLPKPKRDEDLVSDLRLLKKHLEKTQSALATCEKRLNLLDKQLDKDIGALKSSLSSMLTLLKGEERQNNCYTVKPGDSLGLIAIRHKTTTKKLQDLNNLSSDTIFPGQILTIP